MKIQDNTIFFTRIINLYMNNPIFKPSVLLVVKMFDEISYYPFVSG